MYLPTFYLSSYPFATVLRELLGVCDVEFREFAVFALLIITRFIISQMLHGKSVKTPHRIKYL